MQPVPVPLSSQRDTRRAVDSLDAAERSVLTILAVAGASNITRLSELAALAGFRQSPARQHSTSTLRPLVDALVKRGLADTDGSFYSCAAAIDALALRAAERRGELDSLVSRLRPRPSGNRAIYSYDPVDGMRLDARVALATAHPGCVDLLARIAAQVPRDELARDVLLPALGAFDPEWFETLPGPARLLVVELGLGSREAIEQPVHEICRQLERHLDLLEGTAAVLNVLGDFALLRGDWDAARRLADSAGGGDATRGLRGSVVFLAGDQPLAVAASHFASTARKPQPIPGLAGLLEVYTLLAMGRREDLERARAIAEARARPRKEPLRQSFAFLATLAASLMDPIGTSEARFEIAGAPTKDPYSPLVRAHVALWCDTPEFERAIAARIADGAADIASRAGHSWLHNQCAGAADALRGGLPEKARAAIQRAWPTAPPPPAAATGRLLWKLRGARDPWEIAIEGIENLARRSATTGASNADDAGLVEERLAWRVRVSGRHHTLEPLLQKRSGKGYTRGRALALKHLEPEGAAPSALLRRLPPEDARVAAFVRSRREIYGGYPQTYHYLLPEAFKALAGHPRVFRDESDEPVDVALGAVQVVAAPKGSGLELRIEPEDLDGEITVREEEGRFMVYETPEAVRTLAEIIGRGLTLPESARGRALDALGGLSHLVVVQSAHGGASAGRTVPADSTPWIRLDPRGESLRLTVRVRPLGSGGPELVPGRGSTTLLGNVQGEIVQTERDVREERQRAREALEACGFPGDEDTGGDEGRAWTAVAEGLVACLELVSALKALGEAVHVEWPENLPFRLRARAGRRQLRGHLSAGVDYFLATGGLVLDEDLSVELEQLLELVAERPGRFVRLGTGEYLELEQELRELLDSMAAVRTEGRMASRRRGVAIPKVAFPLLTRLTDDDSGFDLDDAASRYRERFAQVAEQRFRVPRTLQAELRPYQVQGFEWLCRLAELELGACLADDMGLGKTVQLIALLLHRRKSGPALVIAPTSVCDNWSRELARFAPSLQVSLYAGADRASILDDLAPGTVMIASYGLLQQTAVAEALASTEFGTIVLDEAQMVKNAESQRARAAFALRGRFRVAATGTPVENHAGDLHSLFRFALPGLLGTYAAFSRRFGKNLSGDAGVPARRALKRLIQPFVLRRTKGEVLDDLPPLTEIQHTVALSPEEARLYEAVRRTALQRLATGGDDPRARVQVLAEITRLRRLCCHPALAVEAAGAGSSKIAAFLDLVSELTEGGHRALVFSQFVDMLALVRAALDERGIGYQYLDGSTPAKARAAAVDAFQAGEGDVFLISLRAGGFGLNLTAADYVIHLDPWWNPAVESQASDRAHRIGQTRPVTVYRLVTAGTIEERIVELHRKKRDLADSILDDTGRSATLSVEELRSLLDESYMAEGSFFSRSAAEAFRPAYPR